jgi:hypothetical protein
MFDPDAGMPRLNRSMVYLGACLIAGIRLARERQVNVRVVLLVPLLEALRLHQIGRGAKPARSLYKLLSTVLFVGCWLGDSQ